MAPVALTKLATRLRCPTCGGPLEVAAQALACAQGHSFDIARQGYVALSRPHVKGAAGDTPAMVAAREAFLAAGYYQPIARALAAAAGRGLDVGGRGRDGAGQTESCVVDLGAGTGDQLSRLLDRFRGAWGIALDASRPALRRAARAHPRMAAIACDAWQELPLADASADLMINSFAPRNGPEIARVLRPHGKLIVVRPAPAHLHQLSSVPGMLAVDPRKGERLRAQLSTALGEESRTELQFDMTLARADAEALVMMGPSAHHVAAEDLERHIGRLAEPVTVTASVIVETFARRT
jgi:23S rRNA (guanine745-N1)-methyltransferase